MIPEEREIPRNAGWRILATVLISVGWLVFVILWLFFYASNFSFVRNLGVIFASGLLLIALLGGVWVAYGLRMGEENAQMARGWLDYRGMRWRIALNILVLAGWSIFLLLWIIVFAGDFSGYQNLAVLFASLLIVIVISSLPWIRMWRYGAMR
jgi:hypothetical protein